MTVVQKSTDNFIISDIINGQRHEVEYLYYTKAESIAKFKETWKSEYELENEGRLDEDYSD